MVVVVVVAVVGFGRVVTTGLGVVVGGGVGTSRMQNHVIKIRFYDY